MFGLSSNFVLADDYLSIGWMSSSALGVTVSVDTANSTTIKGNISFTRDSYYYYHRYCYVNPSYIAEFWAHNGIAALLSSKTELTHLDSGQIFEVYDYIDFSNKITDGEHVVVSLLEGERLHRYGAECSGRDPDVGGGPYGAWVSFSKPYSFSSTSFPTGRYRISLKYAMYDIWSTYPWSETNKLILDRKNYLAGDLVSAENIFTVPAECTLINNDELLLEHGDINMSILDGHTSNTETITVNCNGVTDVNLKVYFDKTKTNTVLTDNGVSLTLVIDDNHNSGTVTKRVNNIMGGGVFFKLKSQANKTSSSKAGTWDMSAIAEINYN